MSETMRAIHFSGGLHESDRAHFERAAAHLVERIERQHIGAFQGDLSIKERGGNGQKTTLELWGKPLPRVVATSTEEDLHAAFREVCENALRQVHTHLDKMDPASNRGKRETIRK